MKALVLKGVGKIALENVADPVIKEETDAIVKLTMTTICGTDLHAVRGTMPGYNSDTVLGHEGVGIVEQVGKNLKHIKVGDRVIVASTIACGKCFYCKHEVYSQCDNANNKPSTAFFGSPGEAGGFNGMQAEKVRVPYADVGLIKVPAGITDEQVILLSDIMPTSYMAVENIHPQEGDVVAVFGAGIVGQLAIYALLKMGIKKVFCIDRIPWRLEIAKKQGAYPINFDEVDPVNELRRLTDNRGPNKIIDAVGIDADQPSGIAQWFKNLMSPVDFKAEVKKVAPVTNPHDGNWVPGNGPSQVLRWGVDAVAKAGIFSIIGVYTELLDSFPIGSAMEKNITVTMGNCNHKRYIPHFVELVEKRQIDLTPFLTQRLPFEEVVTAYKHFDKRDDQWLKVALVIK